MKKGLCSSLLVVGVSLFLAGCGIQSGNSAEEADKTTAAQTNGEQTVNAEGAETTREEGTAEQTECVEPETTEPETSSPFEQYPFGIEGLELYNREELPDHQTGEAYLAASLMNDAKTEDGYFTLDRVFPMADSKAFICYSVSDQVRTPSLGDADGEYDEDIEYTQYLASYDFKTGKILKSIALHNEETVSYAEQVGDCIWYWELDEQTTFYGTCYDFNLQKKAHMTKPVEESCCVSGDNERCYYVKDNCIWEKSLSDENAPEGQKIALSQDFAVYYINGIFTDADGTDYGIIGGMAADFQTYFGIVDLNTGEFTYLQSQDYMTIYVENGSFVARKAESELDATYYVSSSGETIYSYMRTGQEDMSISVLSDGYVLFYHFYFDETETRMYVELYASGQKEPLGSSTFAVQNGDMWFSDTPFVMEEEGLLILPMTDMSGDIYFYCLEYGTSEKASQEMQVKETDAWADAVTQIEYKGNPAAFIPQECPEELTELREKADALEERFGVDIYISDECSNIFGGYAIASLSDYEVVNEALNILEYELGKYPEGFFEQFKTSWIEGIDIYLAGQLMGINGDMLEYAGGFETDYNGSYAVVIDSTSPGNVSYTFHHELSHAIDSQLIALSDEQQVYLDEAYWDSLNPSVDVYGTSYTYNYAQFGRPEMASFTYFYGMPEDAYFIDDYSMTFPTEDRARLFEYIMADDSWIDWENAPHLREKLNYYASCIRSAFDTTGWDGVLWEKLFFE